MANVALQRKRSTPSIKNTQEEDFQWFLDHYKDLFNEYGNVFLAIKNKKVIGKFPSYAEAIRITKQHEKLGSFIVQECSDSPKGFTNYVATIGLTVI